MSISTIDNSQPTDREYNTIYQRIVLASGLQTLDVSGLTFLGERRITIAEYHFALSEAMEYGQADLIARLQNNLACRYFAKNRYQEALTCLQRALGWLEYQYDDEDALSTGELDNELTQVILTNLDKAQVKHKLPDEIIQRLQRAERYARRGERNLADALYEIAGRYICNKLGEGHWVLGGVFCEWAVCKRRMGDKDKAIFIVNRAAPIVNRWCGRHKWLTDMFIASRKQALGQY
jgi:tetratricopeptide (TPR) repeat protein